MSYVTILVTNCENSIIFTVNCENVTNRHYVYFIMFLKNYVTYDVLMVQILLTIFLRGSYVINSSGMNNYFKGRVNFLSHINVSALKFTGDYYYTSRRNDRPP